MILDSPKCDSFQKIICVFARCRNLFIIIIIIIIIILNLLSYSEY